MRRFLISNKLEQLEFKLKKIIGIKKHTGKVRKRNLPTDVINRFILTFSGRDCMDNVCRRVNLQQPDLFGLKFYSRRSYPKYRWVDLDRPLKKQLDKYAQQPTGPLHLGTIHILRKHLYSTKLNLIIKFLNKNWAFL